MKFECPHCLKPGVSLWAKLFVSPRLPAICRVCGEKSIVRSLLALLSLVPVFAAIALSSRFDTGAGAGICCSIGVALYLAIFLGGVPLVRRE